MEKDKFTIKDLDLFYGDFQALKKISMHIPEKEITEPGAAQTFPRQTGVRHQLHALHRRRDAGIHGKTWLPHR